MTTCHTKTSEADQGTLPVKVIELSGVGKKYLPVQRKDKDACFDLDNFWALKDISLDVFKGEILGIIGRNGAGKTTLLNIISGTLSPTEGQVNSNGKVVGLFNLGVGFQDELSGKENIFLNGTLLGSSRKELEDKFDSIAEFSELGDFINMPLGSYSQGMRLRLGFSIIVNLSFDILVIDEVLAVGDALFQDKCYRRLTELRLRGKTLIITNQNIDLIERLCERVVLLDHGKPRFIGSSPEGARQYRHILVSEKFSVGPQTKNFVLVSNTKKWAEDKNNWGRTFGTKDVEMVEVKLKNSLGFNCQKIKPGGKLKIEAGFRIKSKIKDAHFGVAIFREDGVYCYGPNTSFDAMFIPELKEGRGAFSLVLSKVNLAPGRYLVSVAIWDKNESIAYDYHNGAYNFYVEGKSNADSPLLTMPFIMKKSLLAGLLNKKTDFIDTRILKEKWGSKKEKEGLGIEPPVLLNAKNEESNNFLTKESLKIVVNQKNRRNQSESHYLWAGIYREDGVYCQGFANSCLDSPVLEIDIPRLLLLAGRYRVSSGIFDRKTGDFISYQHGIKDFSVFSQVNDHGTVFLEHSWDWRIR